MDVETRDRLYDELTTTVGRRLLEAGTPISPEETDTLATDRERDAGMDAASALGRLIVDRGDVRAIRAAIVSQEDAIRSTMAMAGTGRTDFVATQRREVDEGHARRSLMTAYLDRDRTRMLAAYRTIGRATGSRR